MTERGARVLVQFYGGGVPVKFYLNGYGTDNNICKTVLFCRSEGNIYKSLNTLVQVKIVVQFVQLGR